MDEFEEKITEANQRLFDLSTELMDANHEVIQNTRHVIKTLREYKERFSNLFDELIMTHVATSKFVTDTYGDLILKENGFEQVTVDEDEEEYEEEDDE